MAIGHDAGHYGTPAAFAVFRRRETARVFRKAMRHSRYVRVLRVGIPVCVAAFIIGVSLMAWFDPLRLFGTLPVKLTDFVISGTKIKMEQPRMSGYTRDSRPYDVTAKFASQDITKPNVIELTELRGKMRLHDSSVVEVTAAAGLFNTKSEVLSLEKDIVVTSSAGYEGRLNRAVVDTRAGNLVSDQPVSFKMENTTIRSNGIEIEKSGELIRFKGGVEMTMTRPPGPKSATGQAASQ